MTDKENSQVSADVAAHAGELIDAAPDVQEHVVAQQAEKTAEESANATSPGAEVDKFGVKFDAAKHTGSKLKNGGWRERKVSGSTLNVKKKRPAVTVENGADLDAQSSAAGVAAAQSLFAVSTMCFGAEWQPLSKSQIGYDEQELMGKAFGDYFKSKGVTDFPPGATLACVLIAFAGLRMQMPETKKRVGGMKNWIALRLAKWRVKKEFKKRGVTATVSIGNGELLFNGRSEADWRKENK